MIKKMICIECPKSCSLIVDVEEHKACLADGALSGARAVNVRGARCPKGILYASSEIENPTRILTATVLAEGLTIKFIPVRTDKPVSKKDLSRAMEQILKIRVAKPLKVGDTIIDNFLGLGVRLIATRRADKN